MYLLPENYLIKSKHAAEALTIATGLCCMKHAGILECLRSGQSSDNISKLAFALLVYNECPFI
jgi:hypothetical protein